MIIRPLFQSIVVATLALLLCGCLSFRTPFSPPVSCLFPTVVPMRALQELKPRQTADSEIKELLRQQGLLKALLEAGMRESTLKEVARGLSERGYAEIDSRRARCPILWVSLAFPSDGQTRMTYATTQAPKLPRTTPLEWTSSDSKGKPRQHRQWETEHSRLHEIRSRQGTQWEITRWW